MPVTWACRSFDFQYFIACSFADGAIAETTVVR
jgi:hypothetical protein